MSKKNKIFLKLNGLDKSLEIKKVNEIRLEKIDNEFIYIEKMKSGDWRLSYTSKTIDDISKLQSMEIIRGDKCIETSHIT